MVELAGVVHNGNIIPESAWIAYINALEKQAVGKGSKEALKQSIVEAVKRRIPKQHFGIFLSGGVDSSLITLLCKQAKADFTCYSVGFRAEGMNDAPDLIAARKIAKYLGIKFVEKTFSLEEAEPIIKEAIRILQRPKEIDADYVVKVGVASVVVAANSIAKDTIFFSGLGSEEIFAGYERHVKATDINVECWNGLRKMWQRDFVRDFTVGKALNITLLTPLLDEKVILEAMKIPGEQKIVGEHKKAILREIAEELGLPHDVAWRKKQGAQYGSRFDKALDKLAAKRRMKYKKEYLTYLLAEREHVEHV
ncbi:asparagine synthase C-terminal domain-containing protein [Candidatus Woesearchaeota archaeon]|nr:asparagine synthase C-terminal domain-containing protein [Candidatus Woesearchaeota archaeon]